MKIDINEVLKELNDQQRAAVVHENGPLFVVAGAGTGKTKTLTARIAYLIEEKNVHPEEILGVTFTNKAAREIRERVNQMISPKSMGSWLYTFHAFCLKVLKTHASSLNLGYLNTFSVIDEDDARKIVRDILKDMELDKAYRYQEVRSSISKFKTHMITEFRDDDYYDILENYQSYLQSEQLMDFDDLLIYTNRLLRDNETIRTYYQNHFKHILVDEFQDTDKIQYEIIKQLKSNNNSVFVVGDPDQSIYGFRGARYNNNLLFVNDFNAKTIVLDKNYRSTNNILKTANRFISKNHSRNTEKALQSDLGDGYPVSFNRLETDYNETEFVSGEIKNLVRNYGYKYEEIAVLYRNNNLSRLFEYEFRQTNIPYVIYGGLSFYDRKEVKDILAYLRVIINPNLNFYLKRIINTPSRKIGLTTINRLEDFANENNLSLFDAIPKISLSGAANSALKTFYNLIINMQEKLNHLTEITDIIDIIAKDSGYEAMLKESKDDADRERLYNVRELKTVFRLGSWKYEGSTNIEIILNILDEIALYTDQDKNSDEEDTVKLATVHQVKGLEFRAVFIVVFEETIFPSNMSLESREALEEERRVAYVAITRAKERLYITNARRRLIYGERKFLNESPFIREMTESNKLDAIKEKAIKYTFTDESFKQGDKISHDIFGVGVVVQISEDVLTVAFSVEHGVKKLIKDHPAITKVK